MVDTRTIDLVDPVSLFMEQHQAEIMAFSPFLCFPLTGLDDEKRLIGAIGDFLSNLGTPIVLYGQGHFLDFLLDHAPQLQSALLAIVDERTTETVYRGIPCHTNFRAIPESAVVFICETRRERIWRRSYRLPGHFIHLNPEIAANFPDLVPERAWIPKETAIYPFPLPEVEFQPGLDVLLLDLPSRGGVQFPVGTAYVRKALIRAGVKLQTFDHSIIDYHRYQIHRLFDLGYEPILPNLTPLVNDGWGYGGRVWVDPRQWHALYHHFADDIAEMMDAILRARPKVLALSIHSRNEWIARKIARDIKNIAPEIIILVGGHSCYTRDMGVAAFPEYDYMVVGEADLVVGPLVTSLINGETPANVPGVVSRHDDPHRVFLPGPLPHNLDMLGALDWDIYPNTNQVYLSIDGAGDTALPLTRGCVWSRCSFCAERFAFRSRSPKLYVDEIESIIRSGRSGAIFTSDSDFGGIPEIIHEVCSEIVRRQLPVGMAGQIRINKKFDLDFLKLMKQAGVGVMNFGADAFTENTIRLQRKGYTLDTLLQNYEDCKKADIHVITNIVIGVPGESDEDVRETAKFIIKHKDLFPIISNINCCEIFNNSVYWYEPEKHGIYFYGDKEEIYKSYPFGIPQSLWYTINPFTNKAIRIQRMQWLIETLVDAGVPIGAEVPENYRALISGGGHVDFRAMALDPSLQVSGHFPSAKLISPPRSHTNHILLAADDGTSLAFSYSERLESALRATGRPIWLRRAA